MREESTLHATLIGRLVVLAHFGRLLLGVDEVGLMDSPAAAAEEHHHEQDYRGGCMGGAL